MAGRLEGRAGSLRSDSDPWLPGAALPVAAARRRMADAVSRRASSGPGDTCRQPAPGLWRRLARAGMGNRHGRGASHVSPIPDLLHDVAQLSLAIGGRSDRLDDDESADVQCLACAPDGKRLAVGYGRNVAIYDVVGGERLLSLTCEEGEAKKVAFSPDGKLVCACNGYEWIYLWDAETGAPRGRLGEPSEDSMNVLGVGFIGPNNLWATNQAGGRGYRWETVVWDVARAVVVERLPAVEIAQMARDGRHLMLAMPGMEVEGGMLPTLPSSRRTRSPASGRAFPILSTSACRLARPPCRSTVPGSRRRPGRTPGRATTSMSSVSPQARSRSPTAVTEPRSPAWSSLRGTTRIASPGGGGLGKDFRAMEDQLLRRGVAALDRHDPTKHLPEWELPDQLASASADGAICISPRRRPLSRALWPVGLNGEAREARFSPDGRLLATVSRGTGIQFWGGEDGLFTDEVDGAWDVVFSPDSAKFAGRVRQGVRTWSAGDRRAFSAAGRARLRSPAWALSARTPFWSATRPEDVRLHDARDGAVRASSSSARRPGQTRWPRQRRRNVGGSAR